MSHDTYTENNCNINMVRVILMIYAAEIDKKSFISTLSFP